MPTTPHSRFFGLELSSLGSDLRAAWFAVLQWPIFAWLTPPAVVRLTHVDETQSWWVVGKRAMRLSAQRGADSADAFAVELPEHLVLQRNLVFPAMSEEDTNMAVAMDVKANSPFVSEDLVWGYATRLTSTAQQQVQALLVSRKQITQFLEGRTKSLPEGQMPEVWVLADERQPIVIAGFGETLRAKKTIARRRVALALLASLLLLFVLIAITPSLQLRARALEAMDAYSTASQRTATLMARREALVQATDQLSALKELLTDRVDSLKVFDALTQVLPDDTSLMTLQIQGLKVSIAGQTPNAAALMQLLGAQPGLREVRAPTAATRPLGTTKDSFSIELMLDPAVFTASGQGAATLPADQGASPATSAASSASGSGGAAGASPGAGAPTLPASAPSTGAKAAP